MKPLLSETEDEVPYAVVEHDDGSTTTIYRSLDDGRLQRGEVMAITNPDAVGDEPYAELVSLSATSVWMTCEVVFLNPADFDQLDALQ